MERHRDNGRSKGLTLEEAREFVQEQLKSMGARNISNDELEAYTHDFIQLLKSRDVETYCPSPVTTEGRDEGSSRCSSATPSPAVYKTVVKEGMKHRLPTETTPYQGRTTDHSPKSFLEVSISESGGHKVKRKVLRKSGGKSTYSDTPSPSPSPSMDDSYQDFRKPLREIDYQARRPKSFIRPPLTHPHTRGLKKCDPVQRYHEFREMWEHQKPPGEKPRKDLRWHIREQLVLDTPIYEPMHHVRRPDDYVVPTEKKRQALRWEVRHGLAPHLH